MCAGEPFGPARRGQPFERIGHAGLGVAARAVRFLRERAAADLAQRPGIARGGRRPGDRASPASSARRRRQRRAATAVMIGAAAARIAVGAAIDPRQQREEPADQARDDHRANDLPFAGEVFQQLEEAEEIPLRPRDVASRRSDRRALRAAARRATRMRQQRDERRATTIVMSRAAWRGKNGVRRSGARRGPGRRSPAGASAPGAPTISSDERGGQEDDVRRVPPRQRQRADRRSAAQNAGDDLAGDRRQLRDVDRDDRRPVRALIPRQQVAGQREREDQRRAARAPTATSLRAAACTIRTRSRAACARPSRRR